MSDIDAGTRLALSGSLERPRRWLLALVLIPFVGMSIALGIGAYNAAAQGRAPLMFGAVLAPVIVLLALMMITRALSRAGVRIDRGELVVDTGIGSKRIALSALRSRGVRVVDLNERTDLKPMLRLWGTGLPGFAGGWFRLRNGEKAVCLLLDRHRVTYLRSEADQLSLLLSLRDPDTLRGLLER